MLNEAVNLNSSPEAGDEPERRVRDRGATERAILA
ncbi:TetR/AcrR family transcriptional regulator, partial [Rhizobium phaseoli]